MDAESLAWLPQSPTQVYHKVEEAKFLLRTSISRWQVAMCHERNQELLLHRMAGHQPNQGFRQPGHMVYLSSCYHYAAYEVQSELLVVFNLGRAKLPFCNDRGSRRLAAAKAHLCAEIECPRAHWRGRNRGSVSRGQRGPSV